METEITQYRTLYSDNQGSGFILNAKIESKIKLVKEGFTAAGTTVNVGDMTTINGHFSRPLRYLGRVPDLDSGNKELIFEIGSQRDLFKTRYFYQSVYLISDTRLFEMFSPIAGRDFNYINGEWR